MSELFVDYTACIISGGTGIRKSARAAADCYSPESSYFDELFSREGAAFEEGAAGFLLLDSLLQKNRISRDELILSRSESGRPLASSPDLDFSISHSEGCAMCCIAVGANASVGCDLQRIRDYDTEKMSELAMTFMSDEELAAFYYAPDKSADFFAAWTHREAFVKRSGGSIFDSLRDADLSGESFADGIITVCGNRYYYSIDTAADAVAAAENEVEKA